MLIIKMVDLREKIKKIIDEQKACGRFYILDEASVELIQHILENYESTHSLQQDMENIPKEADLIFIAAPTGAGKDSLVIKFNSQNPDKKYIELNMDIFRHYYKKFVQDLNNLSDKTFAGKTNEFAYEMYFTIQEILLTEFPGTNIIITGTLRETDWVEETFRKYKANDLTNYNISLVSLGVPKKESAFSVIRRYVSIVDTERKSKDFLPGTARYTSLKYHDETYDRFPINLEYFQKSFLSKPGELIDSMEVYKRSKKIDDYKEDTLVYSSKDGKYAGKTALGAVTALRNSQPNIKKEDIMQLFEQIDSNRDYLKNQEILNELIIDLGLFLGFENLMKKRQDSIESNEPFI